MKKLFYGAALLVVAAGSFAFLPKEGEPTEYMMVVCNGAMSGGMSIEVISPSGEISGGFSKFDKNSLASNFTKYQQAQLLKLNELQKAGWSIITVTTEGTSSANTYILEKR